VKRCRAVACILTCIQFKKRYLLLSKDLDAQESPKSKKSKKGVNVLLRELSDDEDISTNIDLDVSEDSERPWVQYFHAYIDTPEQVPEGWSAIKWWGVSVHILSRAFVI
jgi:hypothetical protein